MAHDQKQHDDAMLGELRRIRELLEQIAQSHCSVMGQRPEVLAEALERLKKIEIKGVMEALDNPKFVP